MSEVIFHTEAVPRVNMILQKLSSGRIATFDDYLKNGMKKQLGKLMDFLKNQKWETTWSTVRMEESRSTVMDGLIEKLDYLRWANRVSVWTV